MKLINKRMEYKGELSREFSPYADHRGNKYRFPVDPYIFDEIMEVDDSISIDSVLKWEISLKRSMYKERMNILEEEVKPHSTLYKHQVIGAKWMVHAKRCILADMVGTGKTVTSIEACNIIGAKRILIVCGRNKSEDWIDHFKKWGSDHIHLSISTYESVNKVEGKYDVAIVDEAHKVRNRKTDLFADLRKTVKDIPYLFLITGSPNVNNPSDIWTLLNLCDKVIFSSYWGFVYRFCCVTESAYGVTVGNLRSDRRKKFLEYISHYLLRRENNEEYDVKEKFIKLKMTESHSEIYRYIDKTTEDGISRLNKLLRAAVDPSSLVESECKDTKVHVLLKAKLGKKCIIFCRFSETAGLCKKILRQRGIYTQIINYNTSKVKSSNYINQFKTGNLKVIILTHKVSGEGLNLTAADTIIHMEYPWNSIGIEQANARMLRFGQNKSGLRIFYLVMKETVEEYAIEIIKRKEKFSIENLLKLEGMSKSIE